MPGLVCTLVFHIGTAQGSFSRLGPGLLAKGCLSLRRLCFCVTLRGTLRATLQSTVVPQNLWRNFGSACCALKLGEGSAQQSGKCSSILASAQHS